MSVQDMYDLLLYDDGMTCENHVFLPHIILYLVNLANTLTGLSSANTLTGTTHTPMQSLFNCLVSVNPD